MARLMAPWVTQSVSAARVKLPSRAAVANACNSDIDGERSRMGQGAGGAVKMSFGNATVQYSRLCATGKLPTLDARYPPSRTIKRSLIR
ncbi:hypothetical protein D3C86_1394580 [compost metagenome]